MELVCQRTQNMRKNILFCENIFYSWFHFEVECDIEV